MRLFGMPADQGRAIGAFAFTGAVGASVGLIIEGILVQYASWHWIFFVNLPIGLLTGAAGWRALATDQGIGIRAGADGLGAFLVTAGVMLGVFAIAQHADWWVGLILRPAHGRPSVPSLSMLTVGVDLAAQPKGTAVACVEWGAGRAVVRNVTRPADDEVILAALAEAAKAGIDCPLGWPDEFVAFVRDHQLGAVTVPGDYPAPHWKQRLTLRLTDQVVRCQTGKTPLSVSTDLIGHVALRCACLLAEYAARSGQPVDRTGNGTVVEVYPAASLRVWGLEPGKYKQRAGAPYLGALVDQVSQHAPWLDFGDAEEECRTRHDAFDAVIAALTARAAALSDLTLRPRTPDEVAAAATEGWVAVPLRGTRLRQLISM